MERISSCDALVPSGVCYFAFKNGKIGIELKGDKIRRLCGKAEEHKEVLKILIYAK